MPKSMSDARLNVLVKAALRKAGEEAGSDDAGFLQSLRTHAPMETTTAGGARALSLSLNRQKRPKGPRLDNDPRYLENLRALAKRAQTNARIIGGTAVKGTEFSDCVAVGDDFGWGCTGTLIRPDVVLTAAHCEALHTRVFIGNDVSKQGRIVRVRHHERHAKFSAAYKNDLMLLFLDKKVTGVKPRALASDELIDEALDGRIVGFGTTNLAGTQGYGIKRRTDVPIVSRACRGRLGSKADTTVYGCHRGLEIVAGKPLLQHDTCKGDSGGPFFVADTKGRWFLAGVTSRGTDGATTMCGDGGIYVRLDPYASWISSVIAGQ